jgi:hypothetical protein
MRRHIKIARPERRSQTPHHIARATLVPRTVTRANIAVPTDPHSVREAPVQPPPGFQLDPYLDYGRYLTPEGGILMIYKDFDVRVRQTLWRIFAWILFTGLAANYLYAAPIANPWIKIACLFVAGIINWLIVKKPVELYRRIEIRPDCMIIEGSDVFWARTMDAVFRIFVLTKTATESYAGPTARASSNI